MFFDDPNRHGDPYGLWQLLQEQEKKRQQELLQQQQYLQSPFGQPAQPPEPQGFGHAPSDPSGYGTPRHGLGIPTNVRDLPTTIADLPDMSEAQVRALDKDVYNELFGDANASLVPAWIKIEKMERRKREAAQAAAAPTSQPALQQSGYRQQLETPSAFGMRATSRAGGHGVEHRRTGATGPNDEMQRQALIASLKKEAYELGLAEGTWFDWKARKEMDQDVLRWVTERDWAEIDQRYERGLKDAYKSDMFELVWRAASAPEAYRRKWEHVAGAIWGKHNFKLWQDTFEENEDDLERLWNQLLNKSDI